MESWRRNCVSPIVLRPCVGCPAVIAFLSLVIPVFSTTFVFDGFNGTNLILEAGASLIPSLSVLALTNHTPLALGRALYSTPVQMKSNNTLSSFSTTFVFCMVHPPSHLEMHGLAFMVTPYKTIIGGLASEYLGLLNITSNGKPYNHLFAVEFDTFENVEFDDPDGNHVGVDINNLISLKTESAGYWDGKAFNGINLKSGQNIQAWIEYDSLESQLNVTITLAGLPRPQRPLISQKVDLQNVLQEKMFFGFSAATGRLIGEHYVLAWSFSNEGTAPAVDISRLPSFTKIYSKRPSYRWIASVTVGTLVLLFVVVAAVFFRRAKHREIVEEWENEFWPHRFAYRELNIATNGFRDENVVGRGGFGSVYRGLFGTTQVVGTLGYIAPELTRTGKATPRSDMFSFGVLLWEVACGRKPVDTSMDAERLVLVEWVSVLYAQGKLLDAADPKLGNEYDTDEKEVVLKVGLLCSQPEAERRLRIRLVCQILEGEAPLPDIHMDSYRVNVMDQCSVGVNGCFATADTEARFIREIQGGSRSHGWPTSTSLTSGR